MYLTFSAVFVSILLFALVSLLLTSKNIKWMLIYKYGFLFVCIFIFINLILYPLLLNTKTASYIYLLGIGPGIALMNILGVFATQEVITKLVLASIYSLCVYFLFGASIGSIVEYSKSYKKKKVLKKKQKAQTSLEILIVLAVLIIVAIIVGVLYFSIISKDSGRSSEVIGETDTIVEIIEEDAVEHNPIRLPTGLIKGLFER